MVTQIIQTLSSFFARESDKIAMDRPPYFNLQKTHKISVKLLKNIEYH